MRNRLAASALAALALTSAAPAWAMAQRVYVKWPPVTATQMDADHDACVQQVLAVMNGPHPPVRRPPAVTNGDRIANAFDLSGPRAAAGLEVRCMAEKGYVLLPLTRDEDRALGRARGVVARDAWYDALVAGDLSARIGAVRAVTAP